MDAHELIEELGLEQLHPEGGYFRRTYLSEEQAKGKDGVLRPLMSSIYYLLTEESPISYFHRNESDIVHYFHRGSPLTYHTISPEGNWSTFTLGPDPTQGHQLQALVPGGYWKASQLAQGKYGLISEAVTPAFDEAEMTLANAKEMKALFPSLWGMMSRLVR